MRHLTEAFAVGALHRGRSIEQLLGSAGDSQAPGIRWAEIVPVGQRYRIVLHTCQDIGSESFCDLVEFPPLEDTAEEDLGKRVAIVTKAHDALTSARDMLGTDVDRWVNQGMAGAEYLDYVRAGRPATAPLPQRVDLRPELLPPVVDQCRIDEIGTEITRIADLVHQGRRAEADTAVALFNLAAGRDYRIGDFLEYDGARSLEEFAREAARPAWPRVRDVTRSELVEIVSRIQSGDPDSDYFLVLLRANTPHPHVTNLIFYPPAALADASAAAIVDAALAYRTIAL